MKLYIAEKPSMAAELAKCLPGPHKRREGFIVTGDGIVTWAFGHILRQAEPGEYDEKYLKWRSEDLPIIPATWSMLHVDSSRKQFDIISDLWAKASEIIHAGDPDREGQLLIDEILDYLGNTKTVHRVLLNALDESSIKKALTRLQDNSRFFNLKQSALARARADWLIGMNLSRAYTLAARRAGHRTVLAIGRVKTPTLALVVRRERELDAFTPCEYYMIKANYEHANGKFSAYWKPAEGQSGLDSEGRLSDKKTAKEIVDKLKAQPQGMIGSTETTEKRDGAPLPLSLSALQVLAGKKFGYAPQLVLDTAQVLYERKLTTYPRSDCTFLPESQFEEAAPILTNLLQINQTELSNWAAGADKSIRSRAWNDKKITAHHAIIPTTVPCPYTKLTAEQRNIYFLIARAYIAQFYPPHVYEQTRIEVHHEHELLVANGRVVIDMGWKSLYTADDKDDTKDEDGILPPVKADDSVRLTEIKADKKATKPPVRFTAASLIAAMKDIHKYVKNEELKQTLKDVSGIGTEATRATIINELLERGFMKEEGKRKYLIPTDSAYLLVDALPDEMTFPDATALWEDRLQKMAEGEGTLEEFLDAQIRFTTELVNIARNKSVALPQGVVCSRCGEGVMRRKTGKNGIFWGCSRYPECRATSATEPIMAVESEYACPRCKTGKFVRVARPNGDYYWRCGNIPACRTSCADVDGKPSVVG